MSISPLSNNAAQSLFSTNTQSKKTEAGGFSVYKELTQADIAPNTGASVVAISEAAQAKSKETTTSSGKSAYDSVPDFMKGSAMPLWMIDPAAEVKIDGELGASGLELQARGAAFNRLSGGEQAYYSTTMRQHYVDFLKENDLFDDPLKRFDVLIAKGESSEQFRLQWESRIAADDSIMALRQKMGV